MVRESGKKLWEALEDLHHKVEGTTAEASFDEVLNALVDQGRIARNYDERGVAHDQFVAARSFQRYYRKAAANG